MIKVYWTGYWLSVICTPAAPNFVTALIGCALITICLLGFIYNEKE